MRCARDGNVGELFLNKPKSLEAIKTRSCFVAALRGRFSSTITKHMESRGTADHVLWVKEKDPLPAGSPDFPWLFLVLEGTLIFEDFCLELDIVGDDVTGLLVVDCQREMVSGPLKGIRSLEATPQEVFTLVRNGVPPPDHALSLSKKRMNVNATNPQVNTGGGSSSRSSHSGASSHSTFKHQGREIEEGELVDSPVQGSPHLKLGRTKEAHVPSPPKTPRQETRVALSPFREDRGGEVQQGLTEPTDQRTNDTTTQGVAVQAQLWASHHPSTGHQLRGKAPLSQVHPAIGKKQKPQKPPGKGQNSGMKKKQAKPQQREFCKFGQSCRRKKCRDIHDQPYPERGKGTRCLVLFT